jgi:hypothetical protein
LSTAIQHTRNTSREESIRVKLALWASRTSDVRLLHVDSAGRETELEHYSLRRTGAEATATGDHTSEELATAISRDLAHDASGYPSSQCYQLRAYSGEVAMGSMRFQVEGTLSTDSIHLERANESGVLEMTMRHQEAIMRSTVGMLAQAAEMTRETLVSLREEVKQYRAHEATMLRERWDMAQLQTERDVRVLQTGEEQVRKHQAYQDGRNLVMTLLHHLMGGTGPVTTVLVDEFIGSVTPDQFAEMTSGKGLNMTPEQFSILTKLHHGSTLRKKSAPAASAGDAPPASGAPSNGTSDAAAAPEGAPS